jgi:hypothetical protein
MKRRIVLESLLLPLLLIAGTVRLCAQDRWDGILDRYATICDRCIELRQRISAGEAVPDKSVTALLQELGELRKTLQDASGAMSAAQRTRFRTIQQRYAAASGEKAVPPERQEQAAPVRTKAPAARKADPAPIPVPRDTVPLPPGSILPSEKASALPVEDHYPWITNPATLFPLQESGFTMEGLEDIIIEDPPMPKRHFIDILALYGHGTASSFGLMAAGAYKHWGVWIAWRSNFTPTGASYDITGDGRTASGKFWGNGQSRFGVWSVSGGPLWSPLPWLGFYAGAGYTREELDWQDAQGAWARVRDYSLSGVAAEAGALLRWRHLSFSLGCSWHDYSTLTAGVGVHF